MQVINIAPGERYQAFVKLDQTPGDYAIRASASVTPQFISGYGVLSYAPTPTTGTVIPPAKKQALSYGGNTLAGYTELVPNSLQVFPPTNLPDATMLLKMELFRLSSLTWSLNVDPYAPFLEQVEPLIMNPAEASGLRPEIVPYYPVGSVVDMVIMSNAGNPKHPIHKHGKKAWIIGAGTGNWTWDSVEDAIKDQPSSFNLVNPPKRDGFHTAAVTPSWLVIRYPVTEISVTFIHCHINLHNYGGMATALMEGITKPLPNMPQYYREWDIAAQRAQGARRIRRSNGETANGIGSGSLYARVARAGQLE